jgi:hypothetical protein
MTKTLKTQSTLAAKALALLAAGFIGLTAIGTTPALACPATNSECGDNRLDHEAKQAALEAKREYYRLMAERYRRAREAEIQHERQKNHPQRPQ